MNVLSLFDGISCGQLALQRAGIQIDSYFASEIDKHAISVTQKNHPKTIQIGDVKQVRSSDLPTIDLLIGGSPCQGFSLAGKHLNFDDERSSLFFEFIRLKNELNPEHFLLENVFMKKEFIDEISKLMKVQPILINSQTVSAQHRKRLYWTNIKTDPVVALDNVFLKDIIESGYVDREKSYCLDANYWKGGNLKSYFKNRRRQLVFLDPELTEFRKLTPIECERLQTLPDGYTEGISNTQRYKAIGNGWTVDVIAHLFKNLAQIK